MPYRLTPFVNDNFYHIFNRGVEKRVIFSYKRDYQRFLQTLYYYQFSGPKPRFSTKNKFRSNKFENNPKIVEIVAYCLMPNHFHLLIKQIEDNGVQEFMNKVSNSYTKYYNTKNNRVGPLFQGAFKAVLIESEEQLLHVSRYIHLNPYVAGLTKNLNLFRNSSYLEYTQENTGGFCSTKYILNFFIKTSYQEFIQDYQDYALQLSRIKHLLIDE